MPPILSDIKEAAAPSRDVRLMDTVITTEIMAQYTRSKSMETNDYEPNADKFLQRFGWGVKDATELLGVFHINENHWVSAVVDVLEQSIAYADPRGDDEDGSDVCLALQWFARQHGFSVALGTTIDPLLCTVQEDAWNCGLFATDALAHNFFPDDPLLSPDLVDGDLARMAMLCRIIQSVSFLSLLFESGLADASFQCPSAKALPSIVTQGLHEYANVPRPERHSRSPSPPITPPGTSDSLSHAMGHLSVSPKKRQQKRRRIQDSSDSDADMEAPPMAPIFALAKKTAKEKKKTVTKVVQRVGKAAKKPAAKARKKEQQAAARKQVCTTCCFHSRLI